MRHLTLAEVLELHRLLIAQTGGSTGVRDMGLLTSAVAQPLMTFAGRDLYPTLADKAAALAFSLIKNHPFVDGNKRIGHAAMETLLVLNGLEIESGVDEQESLILGLAAGSLNRNQFVARVKDHVRALPPEKQVP